MQYAGYFIQEAFHGYSFLIRDRLGRVVAEVPTIKEAQEWIDRQ